MIGRNDNWLEIKSQDVIKGMGSQVKDYEQHTVVLEKCEDSGFIAILDYTAQSDGRGFAPRRQGLNHQRAVGISRNLRSNSCVPVGREGQEIVSVVSTSAGEFTHRVYLDSAFAMLHHVQAAMLGQIVSPQKDGSPDIVHSTTQWALDALAKKRKIRRREEAQEIIAKSTWGKPCKALYFDLAEKNPDYLVKIIQSDYLHPTELTYALEAAGYLTSPTKVRDLVFKFIDHEKPYVREGVVYALGRHVRHSEVRALLLERRAIETSPGVIEAIDDVIEIAYNEQ